MYICVNMVLMHVVVSAAGGPTTNAGQLVDGERPYGYGVSPGQLVHAMHLSRQRGRHAHAAAQMLAESLHGSEVTPAFWLLYGRLIRCHRLDSA